MMLKSKFFCFFFYFHFKFSICCGKLFNITLPPSYRSQQTGTEKWKPFRTAENTDKSKSDQCGYNLLSIFIAFAGLFVDCKYFWLLFEIRVFDVETKAFIP